jgi:hypothetical protein
VPPCGGGPIVPGGNAAWSRPSSPYVTVSVVGGMVMPLSIGSNSTRHSPTYIAASSAVTLVVGSMDSTSTSSGTSSVPQFNSSVAPSCAMRGNDHVSAST